MEIAGSLKEITGQDRSENTQSVAEGQDEPRDGAEHLMFDEQVGDKSHVRAQPRRNEAHGDRQQRDHRQTGGTQGKQSHHRGQNQIDADNVAPCPQDQGMATHKAFTDFPRRDGKDGGSQIAVSRIDARAGQAQVKGLAQDDWQPGHQEEIGIIAAALGDDDAPEGAGREQGRDRQQGEVRTMPGGFLARMNDQPGDGPGKTEATQKDESAAPAEIRDQPGATRRTRGQSDGNAADEGRHHDATLGGGGPGTDDLVSEGESGRFTNTEQDTGSDECRNGRRQAAQDHGDGPQGHGESPDHALAQTIQKDRGRKIENEIRPQETGQDPARLARREGKFMGDLRHAGRERGAVSVADDAHRNGQGVDNEAERPLRPGGGERGKMQEP